LSIPMAFGRFTLLGVAYLNPISIKDDFRQIGFFSREKKDLNSHPKEAASSWRLRIKNVAAVGSARLAFVIGKTKQKAANPLFGGFEMEMESKNKLRLEVKEETVLRLLKTGYVCAADLNCLDGESKQCLRLLCLKSCSCKVKALECVKIAPNGLYRKAKGFKKGC